MSKRYFPLQQGGERKRAKLDVSISDHNFPLSQNKEPDPAANWGDDNDDEILLLASQACEEVYNNEISSLPDYSMFSQPTSSSTQLPTPSTSKDFTFKKPLHNPTSIVSTNLKEKCNRISSPLPGITAQMVHTQKSSAHLENSYDKIYKGHDSEHIYRQLLQLQEENEKLKSENGKLLEKCVTKEGETSILRTQLKTCQVAVDNARLEKVKAQEQVQREWNEKLVSATNQMHDLRNQLDFKNLEIISIKEKCKKLESSKVKLTQVTVSNHDISSSHRASSSFQNESVQSKRVKTASGAVQTDGKTNFLTLNITDNAETNNFTSLLPYILEPTAAPHSILEHNDKLFTSHTPQKGRMFAALHNIPSANGSRQESAIQISDIYEDVVKIANGSEDREVFFRVFSIIEEVLSGVVSRLELIKQRMTSAFQKEMDERYIESTYSFIDVSREDLLKGRALFKDEQEILARRMCAILSYILELTRNKLMLSHYESTTRSKVCVKYQTTKILEYVNHISCATIYSGLLLSLTYFKCGFHENSECMRTYITFNPMSFVSIRILNTLLELSIKPETIMLTKKFCLGGPNETNLKTDYDQGVLVYKGLPYSGICYFQVLVRQMEVALKCMETQKLCHRAVEVTRSLIELYRNIFYLTTTNVHDKTKCDCNLLMIQVIVYGLRVCAGLLKNTSNEDGEPSNLELVSLCRCGVHLLYISTVRDVEFCTILGYNEGHMIEFCEIMRRFNHPEVYVNMLSELTTTLQSSPEDMPPSYHRQPWLKSFQTFSLSD